MACMTWLTSAIDAYSHVDCTERSTDQVRVRCTPKSNLDSTDRGNHSTVMSVLMMALASSVPARGVSRTTHLMYKSLKVCRNGAQAVRLLCNTVTLHWVGTWTVKRHYVLDLASQGSSSLTCCQWPWSHLTSKWWASPATSLPWPCKKNGNSLVMLVFQVRAYLQCLNFHIHQ